MVGLKFVSFAFWPFSAFPLLSDSRSMDTDDKSLDDFFAKKDKGKKGKSKSKGKFTTSSAITKQVEKSQKPMNEKSKEQKPTTYQTSNSQIEDEWVDFNEPKEKDYSGLKVQAFQTLDKVDDDIDERAEREDECDGDDTLEKKDKSSSVWQSAHQTAVQAAAPVEEPIKEEVKKEPVKGAYVPPSMRRTMGTQPDLKDQSWKYGSSAGRRDPRRPPEISSEIAFPSLQASADVSSKSEALSSMSFEPVRHGIRASNEQSMSRRMNIDLENKYDALSK